MNTAEILREVERIQKQVEEWEAKIAPAREELEYWEKILKLRQNSSAGHGISIPIRPLTGATIPESSDVQADQTEGYGAKARALRALVRFSSDNGLTIKDLTAECEKIGSHPNMAYRFVDRLSKANPPELERRGDRIYPTEHLKRD
jgi:hypothetical protein